MDNNGNNSSIDYRIEYVKPDIEKYYEEYYENLQRSILSRICNDYPNIAYFSLELSFTINTGAKNASLVHTVLKHLPEEFYNSKINQIQILIETENNIVENVSVVSDILVIVKTWKSMVLKVNGISIKPGMEFYWFIKSLFEKNNKQVPRQSKDIADIKDKYGIKKKYHRTITTKDSDAVVITRSDYETSFDTVISRYIDKYCENKTIEFYEISNHEQVLKIEDDLIVDFRLIPNYWAKANEDGYEKWSFPYVMIQELTKNNLFHFNFSAFRRGFKFDHMGIDFLSFRGFKCYREEIDRFDAVNTAYPELELVNRMNQYEGETHHFVILRMEGSDGKFGYGVGDTKSKVHSYIQRLCKELSEKHPRSLEAHSASCLVSDCGFTKAFTSWKGKTKIWRLENKFSYYYEDVQVKSDSELFYLPRQIAQKAINGEYDSFEFGTYNKPVNKWKSEEQVYNIVKKLYKDYQVIYQYRPHYLSTEKGNMSYDIYICGLSIAIEYQGKQHFEPVDYFGGMESFQRQQERDKLKAKRSIENGIKLLYINYWEDITPDLIRNKIEKAIV